MKYLLKRLENGREVTVAEGDNLAGMHEMIANSKGLIMGGYIIYEMTPISYGLPGEYDEKFQELNKIKREKNK